MTSSAAVPCALPACRRRSSCCACQRRRRRSRSCRRPASCAACTAAAVWTAVSSRAGVRAGTGATHLLVKGVASMVQQVRAAGAGLVHVPQVARKERLRKTRAPGRWRGGGCVRVFGRSSSACVIGGSTAAPNNRDARRSEVVRSSKAVSDARAFRKRGLRSRNASNEQIRVTRAARLARYTVPRCRAPHTQTPQEGQPR